MLFAFVIPPLVNLGATNLQATSRLKEQRYTVYASDGATENAIQMLRLPVNAGCGRPSGSCPVSQFAVTVNGMQGVTTFAPGTSDPFSLDRTVDLTTRVSGTVRVRATVVIRDSSLASRPPVDITSWRYVR
jgi:hypothetical protein